MPANCDDGQLCDQFGRHAVHAAMEIAKTCTETGEAQTILIGFSGHGHFDMAAYAAYLNGELQRTGCQDQPVGAAMKAD